MGIKVGCPSKNPPIYSLKNHDVNSCSPPTSLKFVILFRKLEMMILTQPPPSFLHDVILLTVFFFKFSLIEANLLNRPTLIN